MGPQAGIQKFAGALEPDGAQVGRHGVEGRAARGSHPPHSRGVDGERAAQALPPEAEARLVHAPELRRDRRAHQGVVNEPGQGEVTGTSMPAIADVARPATVLELDHGMADGGEARQVVPAVRGAADVVEHHHGRMARACLGVGAQGVDVAGDEGGAVRRREPQSQVHGHWAVDSHVIHRDLAQLGGTRRTCVPERVEADGQPRLALVSGEVGQGPGERLHG